MKNNRKMIIALGVGIIVCAALGITGIYYLNANEDKATVDDPNVVSSILNNDVSSSDGTNDAKFVNSLSLGIKDFPINDTDVTEIVLSNLVDESVMKTNFTNQKKEFNGVEFNTNCIAYCDDNGNSNHEFYSCEDKKKNICIITESTINNKIRINSYSSKLYVNDKYIFLIEDNTGGISQQSIKVYDKSYDMFFQNDLVFTRIYDENDNYSKVDLVIKDNVLHYITMHGTVNDETVKYVKVDLNEYPTEEEIVTIFKAGYSYEG